MAKSISYISSYTATGTTSIGGGGGTVAAGGAGANLSQNVPAAITFALTHWQANAAAPIHYTSTTDIKIFNSAILKLPELFDIESKSINLFNEKLEDRAKQSVWMEPGQISSW